MKKQLRWYTEQELDFVWFKAKFAMFVAFAVGMLTAAAIYVIFNIITKGA